MGWDSHLNFNNLGKERARKGEINIICGNTSRDNKRSLKNSGSAYRESCWEASLSDQGSRERGY